MLFDLNHEPECVVSSKPLGLKSLRFGVMGIARGAGLGLTLALAGCGASPLATFDISAPASNLRGRALRGVLVIPEPSAPAPADGDRIAVRTGPSSVAIVKGAQWTDRLPRLLQTRLIQTFENARLLRSVARPGDGVNADFALTWDVRRFEMDATTGQAVVDLSVKIVSPAGKVLAAQIFTAQAPGSAGEGEAASLALNAATTEVLRQIVSWASTRL